MQMVEFRQASCETAQERSGGSFALGSLRPRRWRRRSVHDSPCRLSALSETCSSKPWAEPTVSARPMAWARCLGEARLALQKGAQAVFMPLRGVWLGTATVRRSALLGEETRLR